eukprot:TRINITY_DN53151_c0_g1_i1.p2 TRINITY_DN53151_c0_g1~~TRINITY_DN53151_c0_g1_i1.p2  ORF type:complete len:112 (+),score=5.43 TRINITY_DN53151_c0_g1_i1:60-395(+)
MKDRKISTHRPVTHEHDGYASKRKKQDNQQPCGFAVSEVLPSNGNVANVQKRIERDKVVCIVWGKGSTQEALHARQIHSITRNQLALTLASAILILGVDFIRRHESSSRNM